MYTHHRLPKRLIVSAELTPRAIDPPNATSKITFKFLATPDTLKGNITKINLKNHNKQKILIYNN